MVYDKHVNDACQRGSRKLWRDMRRREGKVLRQDGRDADRGFDQDQPAARIWARSVQIPYGTRRWDQVVQAASKFDVKPPDHALEGTCPSIELSQTVVVSLEFVVRRGAGGVASQDSARGVDFVFAPAVYTLNGVL